jgi:hypothetical protein
MAAISTMINIFKYGFFILSPDLMIKTSVFHNTSCRQILLRIHFDGATDPLFSLPIFYYLSRSLQATGRILQIFPGFCVFLQEFPLHLIR